MRIAAALLLLFATVPSWTEEPKPADMRFGIARDAERYPQGTAKETLASVLAAIKAEKFDYLLAHLVDPAFVDDRVKRLYGGRFEQQVTDTRTRLTPAAVRQLQKFAAKGDWSEKDGQATVTLADADEHLVVLKKIGPHWYLENRNRPEKKKSGTED